MSHQRFDWVKPGPVSASISKELDTYSAAMRSILFHRGITSMDTALEFLLPKPPAWSPDFNLIHVERSVRLILDAIRNEEIISVYGDYDADGITATALVILALREVGAEIIPYIPDRIGEGYGLNNLAIDSLADQGVSLLITVDNGIRSIEEVDYAISRGMRVIITDHHTPGKTLPNASSILNPKLPDDPYPNKNLAGVGVAYKLICALSRELPQLNPADYLDLVAIGTVADIVPLQGENRYLVRQGLSRMNTKKRQAIQSLLGAAGRGTKKISAADISFQIAPRINSSGRLETESASTPLDLLLSSDPLECSKLAQILDNHNQKRKLLSRDLEARIEDMFKNQELDAPIMIAFASDVQLGVAGIAAGHLTRKFNLPAVVGQTGDEFTTASCRSIPGFNMIESLDSCRDLFSHYGGHKLAAGFTLPNENLPRLVSHLNDLAAANLPHGPQLPILEIDADVKLEDLNQALIKELEKIEPTGPGNPVPVFLTRDLSATDRKLVGSNSDHLKLVVFDGKYAVDAIGFGFGEYLPALPDKFDLVYNLSINEFRGKRSLQLQILDLAPS